MRVLCGVIVEANKLAGIAHAQKHRAAIFHLGRRGFVNRRIGAVEINETVTNSGRILVPTHHLPGIVHPCRRCAAHGVGIADRGVLSSAVEKIAVFACGFAAAVTAEYLPGIVDGEQIGLVASASGRVVDLRECVAGSAGPMTIALGEARYVIGANDPAGIAQSYYSGIVETG